LSHLQLLYDGIELLGFLTLLPLPLLAPRELLKGPLYYAGTITLATSVFWRTSPIGIAAICNLCAGDGTCLASYWNFICLIKICNEPLGAVIAHGREVRPWRRGITSFLFFSFLYLEILTQVVTL